MQKKQPRAFVFLFLAALAIAIGIGACGESFRTTHFRAQPMAPQGGGAWSHTSGFGGGDLHVGSDGNGGVYYLDSYRSSYTSGN